MWRDVQRRAATLRQSKPRPALRVLGVDGGYGRVAGQPHTATIAVDPGTGHLITLAEVDEHSVEQVMTWLQPWVAELGIEVLVSDDLAEYGQVAEQWGLQHQVCRFHLSRWVERALRELQGALHVKTVASTGARVAHHGTARVVGCV